MRTHDAFADREAEAGAAAAGLTAVELLEDLALLSGGQSRTAIGDLHGDGPIGRGREDADRTSGGRVLEGVVQQVDQYLLDEDVVDGYQRQIGRHPGRHPSVSQPLAESVERRADHLFQRMPFPLELEGARFQTRHLEQVVDQAVQPLRLSPHRLQQFLALARIDVRAALQDGVDASGDGRQRRSEVMGHRAEQRIPQALRLHPHPRVLRLLGQQGTLDGERGLVGEGLELVRIGKPLRPEFAAWRYGDQFGRRRRKYFIQGAVALAGVATIPLVGPVLGLSMGEMDERWKMRRPLSGVRGLRRDAF